MLISCACSDLLYNALAENQCSDLEFGRYTGDTAEEVFYLVDTDLHQADNFPEGRVLTLGSSPESQITKPIKLGRLYEILRISTNHLPVKLGDALFDEIRLLIRHNDKTCSLTQMEADIVKYLLSQNTPTSRENLLEHVWSYDGTTDTHTVETHIYRLKNKLSEQLGISDFISYKDEGYIISRKNGK